MYLRYINAIAFGLLKLNKSSLLKGVDRSFNSSIHPFIHPFINLSIHGWMDGVGGHALEWFNSYLLKRCQAVYINGVLSDKAILKCGVSQGSILGPLLFLIYINDLTNIADYATTRMYADDTNMTFTANNILELQHDINVDFQYLQNWLIANRLTLNVLKTEYMLVGSRQRKATLTQGLNLSMNGISLKKK